jgi:small subunit ribosomal protein S16
MLRIRLARGGKHKTPFYRIVLTEHTKPVKSGYSDVLGWFDPLHHTMDLDVEKTKALIAQGAQPSSRVAKLAYAHSKDEAFKKFIVITERTRKVKNEK